MRAFRYISVLGVFAAVGAALAIGLALSMPPDSAPVAERSSSAGSTDSLIAHNSESDPDSPTEPAIAEPRARQLRPTPAPAEQVPAADARAPLPPQTPVVDQSAPAAELAPSLTKAPEPRPAAAPAPPPPPIPTSVPIADFVADQVTNNVLQKLRQYAGKDNTITATTQSSQANPAAAEKPAEPAPPPPAARTSSTTTSVVVEPERKPAVHIESAAEGDGKLSMTFDEDIEIRKVLNMLAAQSGRNIVASKNVQGKISMRLNDVDVDTALDAVARSTGYTVRRDGNFIYVGSPEEFLTMEQSLDRVSCRVYRPNYVAAAELQALITPMLTEKVGLASVSSPAEVGIGPDSASAGGNKFAGGDVVVVRDYEATLAQIDQVVAEVDVRPMQVAIEAMILSVKLQDDDKLGVSFEFFRNNPNFRLALGAPPGAIPKSGAFNPGLQLAYLDGNLGAFIDALQSYTETNVIATPRIMCINKQRAEIQVGREQGYVSSTTATQTTSTATVEMMKTGTILLIRPYISVDGLIRLEVHPELSTGDTVVKGTTVVPDKEVTQVTTNVMVRDGCTVILGGLLRNELSNESKQVPLLGNLPVVGAAFRNKTEKTTKHEILVLMTPHIVYEPDSCREGDKAACEFHRRQAVAAEKMSPWGKRYVGRKYYRLAQNAWAAGDQEAALRMAEMAVQFDPQNRAAIDLRSDIWQGKPAGDHTLPPIEAGELTAPLDGQQMPEWLLNDLENQAPAAARHPLDPGETGRNHDILRPRKLQ